MGQCISSLPQVREPPEEFKVSHGEHFGARCCLQSLHLALIAVPGMRRAVKLVAPCRGGGERPRCSTAHSARLPPTQQRFVDMVLF